MDRTVACNAWIQLSEGLPPEPDDEDAMEGNAADWVAKQWAQGNEVAHGVAIPLPGDFTVDYDMIHGAKMWVGALGYGAVSGVPVVCERIHPTDCWGEPDGWRWDGIEGILRVPDYKYGFGIVEVFENWQLIPYAAGLMTTLGLKDSDVTIEFKIVQPRAHHKDGPVRTWRVQGDRIRALVNIAHGAAVRAWPPESDRGVTPPPVAKTGPHCLHCPARVHCTTFQQAAATVLEFAGIGSRTAMDADAVGVQLLLVQEAMEILQAQGSALSKQAEFYLRNGKRVTNFAMEPTTGALKWNDDVTAAEVVALGQTIRPDKQIDLKKPPGALNSRSGPIVTPTQAIKAGVDATVISQYASRPPGAMKLARESSTDARRAFGVSNT